MESEITNLFEIFGMEKGKLGELKACCAHSPSTHNLTLPTHFAILKARGAQAGSPERNSAVAYLRDVCRIPAQDITVYLANDLFVGTKVLETMFASIEGLQDVVARNLDRIWNLTRIEDTPAFYYVSRHRKQDDIQALIAHFGKQELPVWHNEGGLFYTNEFDITSSQLAGLNPLDAADRLDRSCATILAKFPLMGIWALSPFLRKVHSLLNTTIPFVEDLWMQGAKLQRVLLADYRSEADLAKALKCIPLFNDIIRKEKYCDGSFEVDGMVGGDSAFIELKRGCKKAGNARVELSANISRLLWSTHPYADAIGIIIDGSDVEILFAFRVGCRTYAQPIWRVTVCGFDEDCLPKLVQFANLIQELKGSTLRSLRVSKMKTLQLPLVDRYHGSVLIFDRWVAKVYSCDLMCWKVDNIFAQCRVLLKPLWLERQDTHILVAFPRASIKLPAEAELWAKFGEGLLEMHSKGIVHGDCRGRNIIHYESELFLIDVDWCGEVGKVVYPPGANFCTVQHAIPGEKILKEHDRVEALRAARAVGETAFYALRKALEKESVSGSTEERVPSAIDVGLAMITDE